MRAKIFLLGAAMTVACSSDDFEPVSYVDTLRVLAVRAGQSWLAPGETAHLDTLLADPTGGGRAVSWAWSTCENPGSQELSDCRAAAAPFALGGDAREVTVPLDALSGRPPSEPLGTVGVLFAACAGTLTLAPTPASPVTCVDATGRVNDRSSFMWGEKRIVVAPIGNQNPTIASVLLDGTAWGADDVRTIATCDQGNVTDCDASSRHHLEIVPAPGSAETVDGQKELLVAFFFVSSGGVADDFARADVGALATDLAAIHTPPGTPATAWLVLRDDRGGVDWVVRRYATP